MSLLFVVTAVVLGACIGVLTVFGPPFVKRFFFMPKFDGENVNLRTILPSRGDLRAILPRRGTHHE